MYPSLDEADGKPLPPVAFPSAPPAQGFVVQPSMAKVETWTTSLCGCFDDPSNCCITFCCPCITVGQTAEVLDQGNTSCLCAGAICLVLSHLGCCSCWYTCTYRTKLRAQFSLPGSQVGDFCVHCCCQCCAMCQEYRELKNHGLDPSIGWIANQQKMQQQIPFNVPVQMGMTR